MSQLFSGKDKVSTKIRIVPNAIKHHHAQKRQPIITMITGCTSYPRRESNPDLRFRKPSFYPLNYGGIA